MKLSTVLLSLILVMHYSFADQPIKSPEQQVKTSSTVTSNANQLIDKQSIINLNSADESTLLKLKGIGKSKAKAIIYYRNQKGGFKSIEELLKVKGIGKKVLYANQHRITI